MRFRYKRHVMYKAPCGRRLRNVQELHRYLMQINSEMSIDLFDFESTINCLAEFTLQKRYVTNIVSFLFVL